MNYDDDDMCEFCHKEFNEDRKQCRLFDDIAICEECRLEHVIGSCDYCDCPISMLDHPSVLPGCSYPIPPGITHENDEYFLCPDCADEYMMEYPNWDNFMDITNEEADGEDSDGGTTDEEDSDDDSDEE